MVSLGFELDADEQKDTGFGCKPAGEYLLQIISDVVSSNYNDKRINFKLQILKPEEFNGKILYDSATIASTDDEKIARGKWKLVQIAKACGVKTFSGTDPFHFIPMIAKVSKYKGRDGKEHNGIDEYRASGSFKRPISEHKPREAYGAGQGGAYTPEPTRNSTDGW